MSSALPARPVASTTPTATNYSPWVISVALMSVVLFVYWPSWQSMIKVWNTPTYSHAYFVPLAAIWLAYDKRQSLAELSARPWWLALPALLAVGLAWLIGNLAGVNALEHLAVISSIALIVAFSFGRKIATVLIFPLAFLLLAVPFGEFLVPYMMTWTANVTVWLVQASGVPIYREGLSFILPSGAWQVVEECSGQRYLIALVPLALIYGHLTFTQIRTKVLFLLVSLVVAIVANWLRAYLIVMTGHLSGMKLATGIDHLVYGWFFFGIIVALLFFWGSRWSELGVDGATDGTASTSKRSTAATMKAGRYPFWATLVSGVLVLSVGNAAAHLLAHRGSAPPELSKQLAQITQRQQIVESHSFEIPFNGTHDQLQYSLNDGSVNVWVGGFLNDSPANEMVRAAHTITGANRTLWRHTGSVSKSLSPAGTGNAREFRFVRSGQELLVWQMYFVNAQVQGGERAAKIQLALQQLKGNGAVTHAAFLWTSVRSKDEVARQKLAQAASQLAHALSVKPDSE